MASLVPEDLMAFLKAGKRLRYDAESSEAGRVVLHRPEGLREMVFRAQTYGTPAAGRDPHAGESGTYAVPGIDLIARCTGDYDPEGILVWFPGEARYGTVDTDHDYVLLFGREVAWPQIVASPGFFLDAQWAIDDLEDAGIEVLEPWHRYPWEG